MADAGYAALDGLAEGSAEAQQRQRKAAADRGLPLEVHSARTGIRFRLVPAGIFMMGSPAPLEVGGVPGIREWTVREGEVGRLLNEGPQTRVELTKPMYVGTYEVTQEQWQAVMGRTVAQQRDVANSPWPLRGEGPDLPIYYVSWEETQEFLKRLCDLEGVPQGTYRLLTEPEWEYACRAGTTMPYYTGTTEADLGRAGWNSSNSGGETRPVGLKEANAWGLHDMHGNVGEWCSDLWTETYPGGSVVDPTPPGSSSYRVFRGGGGLDAAGQCRSAFRLWRVPGFSSDFLGLRLLRVAP
jgi:formylglycine-generating enzyme required for sulfatase activity